MSFRRARGLVPLLLLAMGCGGGGGHGTDAAHDAASKDASILEAAGPVEAAGLAEAASPDGASTLDAVPVDLARADVVDTPMTSEVAPVDLGPGAIDGGLDGATADGGVAPGDPCVPGAIVALPLVGAGSVTVASVLSGTSHLRPQTAGCAAGDTGPENVYALQIPAGEFHLVASTVSATTTADTIVYAQTSCGAGAELACNDDVGLPGPSSISARVTGPRTLYLVVDSNAANPLPGDNGYALTVTLAAPTPSGAACTPVNPGQLDPCAAGFICPPAAGAAATCAAATAPVIDAVELFPQIGQPATETTLFLSAHDGQGDWRDLTLVFRGSTGVVLDSQVQGLTDDWGEAALVESPQPLSAPLGTLSVDVTITDAAGLSSLTVTAALVPWSMVGQSCDVTLAAPDPCLAELVCVAGACAAGGAASTACAQAPTITFGTEVDGTAADLVADTFEGSCYTERGGHDRVYRAVLPALPGGGVAWDLLVSTANAGVAWSYRTQLDTYLHVRTTCADPATELACNDDVALTDLRSQVVAMNLAPGTYYVYLDTSSPSENGTGLGYAFVVQARAVLASGSTCDPNGVDNRCQGAACLASSGSCP